MFANVPCIHGGLTHMMWSALFFNSRPIAIICSSTGLQGSSHPCPICFFLCGAQCSVLTGCALIVALLACLDLVQTKHGWQHIVVNCLAVLGTTGMSYLGRPGGKSEEGLICLLSPDLWELVMISYLQRYWGGGWWLWGLLPLTCGLFSVNQGAVCVSTQERFMVAFALTCDAFQFSGKGVRSAGSFMMRRWPHDRAVLWNILTELKQPPETNTDNHLPLNERIFSNFSVCFKARFILSQMIYLLCSIVVQF